MSLPESTMSKVVTDLPPSVLVTADRNLPGFFFEKSSKKTTARSGAFGSGVAGLSFIHLATICWISLCPSVHIGRRGLRPFSPRPGQGSCAGPPIGRQSWVFPGYLSAPNQLSTSGATGFPAFGPLLYVATGPIEPRNPVP